MTGTPMDPDQHGTQYSPIGHYFPPIPSRAARYSEPFTPHPTKHRSRYWLHGPSDWDQGTINAARQDHNHGIIQLAKYSQLRLPHVYTLRIDRFKAFGGNNALAIDYRLDEASYYRLMDRLGLNPDYYVRDIFPRPPSGAWPSQDSIRCRKQRRPECIDQDTPSEAGLSQKQWHSAGGTKTCQ